MSVASILRWPLDAAMVFSGAKSFEKNSVLGSPYLNKRGLHRMRVRKTQDLAERRRTSLFRDIDARYHAPIREQGFVRIDNFLPDDVFSRVQTEIARDDFYRIDMKQGKTITRRAHIDKPDLTNRPGLDAAVHDPRLVPLIRAVASYSGQPLLTLQVVMAEGGGDPQAVLHSDTFQPTAKAWLFLHDVPDDGGPFLYVPGSHKMTPERYDWEEDIAINAAALDNVYAARGSLRLTPDMLGPMGYGAPERFAVPANTLVVADTHGFHARSHSEKPTTRIEIYGSLRRNPFAPFALSPLAGLHAPALPFIRNRIGRTIENGMAMRERLGGRRSPWRPQGIGALDARSTLLD